MAKCKKCKEEKPVAFDPCPWCGYLPQEEVKKLRLATFIVFKICRSCANWIPINGLIEEVTCPHCGDSGTFHPQDMAITTTLSYYGWYFAKLRSSNFMILRLGVPGPQCPHCGKTAEVLETLRKGKKTLTCSHCKKSISCISLPSKFKRHLKKAVHLINVESGKKSINKRRHIVLGCPSCGAGLKIGTKDLRLQECEYCGSTFYLSEDAWRMLHMVEISHSWSVSYTGKQLKTGRYRKWPPSKMKNPPNCRTLTVYVYCEYCNAPLPVNGPTRECYCHTCGKRNKINIKAIVEKISKSKDGCIRNSHLRNLPGFQISTFQDQAATCTGCRELIPIAPHIRKGTEKKKITCEKCQKILEHYIPPGWFKKLLPMVHQVFGAESEQQQSTPAQTIEQSALSFLMSCPICGSPNTLTIKSGTTRMHTCSACSSQFMIPAEIWWRFYPIKKLTRWVIHYNGSYLDRKLPLREKFNRWFSWKMHWQFGDFYEKYEPKFRKVYNPVKAATIEINYYCQSCGKKIPVNGLGLTLTCSRCLYENSLDAGELAEVLVDASQMDKVNIFSSLLNKYSVDFKTAETRRIICPNCSESVKIPKNKLSKGKSVQTTCRHCGIKLKGGPPPDWLKKKIPALLGLFNAVIEQPLNKKNVTYTKKRKQGDFVELTCPLCEGDIQIKNETVRTALCRGCDSEVYIPDQLWRKLHPVEKSHSWALIFRGKNLEEGAAERRGAGSKTIMG